MYENDDATYLIIMIRPSNVLCVVLTQVESLSKVFRPAIKGIVSTFSFEKWNKTIFDVINFF